MRQRTRGPAQHRRANQTHQTYEPKGGSKTERGTRDFVYAQGWYSAANTRPTFWPPSHHERTVTGGYRRVALALMVDQAKQYTTVNYPDSLTEDSGIPEIKEVCTALRAFAKDEHNTVWALNDKLGDTVVAQAFRHQHLHVSFKEGKLGYSPRFKDDTALEREVYRG